jgi:hypothetical protein
MGLTLRCAAGLFRSARKRLLALIGENPEDCASLGLNQAVHAHMQEIRCIWLTADRKTLLYRTYKRDAYRFH